MNRVLPRALYGSERTGAAAAAASPRPLATRLERAFAELRTLAARQEATLEPLAADGRRAASWPRCRSSRTPPGSLADLDALACHLLPDADGDVAPARGRGV